MTKLILAVVGGTLLAAAVLIFWGSGSGGKIEVNPPGYDLGTISMADGKVSRIFEVKNVGEEDLAISAIWTSCDCTTAQLSIGERTSPELGMHTNLPFWSETLSFGETGYLEVIFDPAFHGEGGAGELIRAVYIQSSDPQNKKAEVRLTATVIK